MAGVVLSLLWKAGVAPKGEKTLTAVKLHNLENHLMQPRILQVSSVYKVCRKGHTGLHGCLALPHGTELSLALLNKCYVTKSCLWHGYVNTFYSPRTQGDQVYGNRVKKLNMFSRCSRCYNSLRRAEEKFLPGPGSLTSEIESGTHLRFDRFEIRRLSLILSVM